MRTTLTRALVGLGLASAMFLGAGAAVAQTADDSSSGSSTTTAQDSQSTQSADRNGSGAPADCPDPLGGAVPPPPAGWAAGQSQPRRLKMAYRVRLTTSIRARAKGYPNTQRSSGM